MNQEPLVSVTAGNPTPEEVAALVAALSTRSRKPAARPVPSAWARSARPGQRPASWNSQVFHSPR